MLTITAVGYIGQDAKFENESADKSKQLSFSLAVTETYLKDGNKQEKTTCLKCYYYSNSDKLLQLLTKGSAVAVTGGFSVSSYVTNQGSSDHVIYVQVSKLSIVHSKTKDNG